MVAWSLQAQCARRGWSGYAPRCIGARPARRGESPWPGSMRVLERAVLRLEGFMAPGELDRFHGNVDAVGRRKARTRSWAREEERSALCPVARACAAGSAPRAPPRAVRARCATGAPARRSSTGGAPQRRSGHPQCVEGESAPLGFAAPSPGGGPSATSTRRRGRRSPEHPTVSVRAREAAVPGSVATRGAGGETWGGGARSSGAARGPGGGDRIAARGAPSGAGTEDRSRPSSRRYCAMSPRSSGLDRCRPCLAASHAERRLCASLPRARKRPHFCCASRIAASAAASLSRSCTVTRLPRSMKATSPRACCARVA